MRNAVITSTGAYLPKKVLDNAYFDELLGLDVSSWLEERMSIYQRHWCGEGESTVDLCVHSANQALQRAGLSPRDLDLIIVATDTPEYLTPSTASVVQYKLGAGHAGTFDLNAACAGFVTSMDVAGKYIKTDDRYQHVLVIGAYAISSFLDLKDKKTVTLFADGAGAIILSRQDSEEEPSGILDSELVTLGQYHDGMGIYGGGAKNPFDVNMMDSKDHTLKIKYRLPPELNIQMWTSMSKKLLTRNELQACDVEHYFLTQININSIEGALKKLKVPTERGHTTMQKYGYTGSACIPITINDAIEKGKLSRGDTCFLIGSGSGLTFGALALKY
ncbi:MAG: ketoacyl-ACP synthase III [Bacteroidia bacterium]|nr:ketoacyl-ACP synthase III [Bacteroidia bacterium]